MARGRPEVALLLDGGELLVAARLAPLLLEGLHALDRQRRSAGGALPVAAVELADLLTAAKRALAERAGTPRTAAATAAAVAAAAATAQCPKLDDLLDPIGTTEVARMLGCKERNARDLCARGVFPSARKTGAGWLLERAELDERPTPTTARHDRENARTA